MAVRLVCLFAILSVHLGVGLAQVPQEIVPAPVEKPAGESGASSDDIDSEDAPKPKAAPAKKPPDGLLPVAELSRLEFTPRDRPKAILYGHHLLVVGSSGFVEGHDAENGEFLWKLGLPGEDLFDPLVFDAGPLVNGATDAITVVLSEPSGHLLLVDGLTGEIQQEARLPFELALPPIRGPGDIIFFATPSGDIVGYDVRAEQVTFQTATGERPLALSSIESLLIVSGSEQILTALDLPTGTLRWTFRGRASFHAPAVFDREGARVYVGDDTGELYSLDAATGSVKFRWSTGASIRSAALVEGKRLYLASWANTLFAFNAQTGDEHWRVNLPGRPATGPTRVRNRLLVGTYDGVLVEIDPGRARVGKQFVAPGEIVVPPSFFLARATPEELAQSEASDMEGATEENDEGEGGRPLDDDGALDPDIFGPEELDGAPAPPTDPNIDPNQQLDPDDEPAETDTTVEVAQGPPAWFERSRIAMALRSGQVLVLSHQLSPPSGGEGAPEEPGEATTPEGGGPGGESLQRRPPTDGSVPF